MAGHGRVPRLILGLWREIAGLNAPFKGAASVPIPKFASYRYQRANEFRNRKDTSNLLISSVVLVSKFAMNLNLISAIGELRNHDTRPSRKRNNPSARSR